MTAPYRVPLSISFKHCDPAGIVFYPRYVEMLNDVVEQWFKSALRCDFATLHGPRAIAVPVVNLQVDFKAPAHLGESLQAELVVDRLGKSSLGLCIAFRGPLEPDASSARLHARLTLVFVQMQGKRPVDIPEDLRRAALPFVVTPAAVNPA